MADLDDFRLGWLRLARLPSIGPVLAKRLLETFKTPEGILNAHPAALSAVEGIGTYRANQIVAGAKGTEGAAREELAKIEADGVTLLTYGGEGYPVGLLNIPDPPVVLYVRGEIVRKDAVAVGIVGARQCTVYGREQAQRFSAELAEAGMTVVSGGARGIDTAAHLGALRVKGRTIVVQGCGLRHTYPPENKGLYERIVGEGAGAIVSEFALDAPPTAENFPPRNRIIAGMSLGILVVEANLRSGSLITARLAAADYGREVFALPGAITSAASAGTHHLIKTGTAHLVDSVEDILRQLGEIGEALLGVAVKKRKVEDAGGAENDEAEGATPAKAPQRSLFASLATTMPPAAIAVKPVSATVTSTRQKILAALTTEPTTIDDLIEATGLAPNLLIAELTVLQIKNLITRLPGNQFARKDGAP